MSVSRINNVLVSFYLFCISFFKLKKTIIFLSRDHFSDSPKVIYDYLVENNVNKNYELIWMVFNMEQIPDYINNTENVKCILHKPASFYQKLKGLYEVGRASYTIYSHDFVGNKYSKKQCRIFTTHASPPLKNSTGHFVDPNFHSIIMSTSKFAAQIRCKTFRGGDDKIKITGLPRNDKLFASSKDIKKKFNLTDYNKIIIWMPTFKRYTGGVRNDFEGQFDTDISILNEKNIERLNSTLFKLNSFLLIKYHPGQNMAFVPKINKSNISTIPLDFLVKNNIDTYSLLGCADALITDFSSVYFDYLLLDRPIAFELSDIEAYKKGVGFIFDNPFDYMPGDIISNIDSFEKFILSVVTDNDLYGTKREKIKNLMHQYNDDKATERLIKLLEL